MRRSAFWAVVLALNSLASAAFAQFAIEANATSIGAVTLSGSQTITGAKTFSAGLISTTGAFSGLISSSVASGSSAITLTQGARFFFSGSAFMAGDGTTASQINVSGSSLAPFTDNSTALGLATKRWSGIYVQNILDGAGASRINTGSSITTITSTIASTGSVVANIINNSSTLSAGDTLLDVRNNGSSRFKIGYAGNLTLDTTDSTASPGAATINKPTGKSSVANGAASVVITNSLVTTASSVSLTPMGYTANCEGVYVTVAAGSFTVTCPGGNAAADFPFSWWVRN